MNRKLFLASAALAAMACTPAWAQTVSHDGAVLTYEPPYFEAYNPVTALDMVRQVPGFSIDNGASVRGLADTFANVLVDGERQNTKSESIQDILQRIPADRIERVELVREAVPGVDMRGQSRVVNLVLTSGSARSTTVSAGIDYFVGSDVAVPGFDVSTSWEIGQTRLTLGAGLAQNAAPSLRSERFEDAAGTLIETRDERTSQRLMTPSLNGSVNHVFEDGSRINLSLNGSYSETLVNDRSLVDDASGAPDRVELFRSDVEETSWEGTLTYERPFSESVSGQVVLLNRDDTYESADSFLFAPYAGSGSTTWFDNAVDSGERALRGTLTWEMSERHSFEFGAETALNYLDNALAITEDTGSGPVAVPLPVANTRVEERRSELFASHVWRPMDDVTVESGFRFERSTIEQTGDASRERSFNYPKPSISLTWTPSEETQWEFTLVRSVAQLSFDEFASEVNPRDDQTLIGNPELVPQKTWRGTARWERRWGEDGTVSVSLTHERVQDVQDSRPVTLILDPNAVPVASVTFDAPGNIGDGHRTYLIMETSLPLDGYGLGDARLNLTGVLRHTEVTDPTTGATRRFAGNEDWRLSADFRQNLPQRDLAWGWRAYVQGNEDLFRYSDGYDFDRTDPQLTVFVETTIIEGMTINLEYGDFTAANQRRTRTFYDGSRANDVVRAREIQDRDLGGYVSLWARATF
ncbi:TonB-dependent receptor plug domain-containing protein [Maricaulis parjimensis]|uniref:TonB-dependent receptor plug domain-containing protein n=1 Tax=Maricaulis parjimensis TaxID=144023 RepID=UPI001EEEDE97|nr:TonB-dependent receptor [Maricaulis parjimensis]